MPNSPIESKVRAAASAAGVLGAVLTALNSVGAHSALLGAVPPWAQSIITLLVPPLSVLTAGWLAPHTPRTAPPPAPAAVPPVPDPAPPAAAAVLSAPQAAPAAPAPAAVVIPDPALTAAAAALTPTSGAAS